MLPQAGNADFCDSMNCDFGRIDYNFGVTRREYLSTGGQLVSLILGWGDPATTNRLVAHPMLPHPKPVFALPLAAQPRLRSRFR
jgi:hypothetical protein